MCGMKIVSVLTVLFLLEISIQAGAHSFELDVISYKLKLAPNIDEKFISGSVTIKFQIDKEANSVAFKSGNLKIDKVTGDNLIGFKNNAGTLLIELSQREKRETELTIDYHGNPTGGLLFDSDLDYAFTVYSTSQWMICNDSPGDRALFEINLSIPAGMTCIASGELISEVHKDGKVQYSYRQNYESPTYTYGFAIGNFRQAEEKLGKLSLLYYAQDYSFDQLMVIFRETPTMITFFEERSGITYHQPTYSQILIGDYYQEMAGYSILKDSYGKLVLQDSTETNLISHELAHQWWGNRVTCRSWNHFWLNEAMATFMSAAYNEYRFGEEVYLDNINSYYQVYEGIKHRGNDKPLVFKTWSNPSKDDRNLVYFKGAYVLHLLREKIGDDTFWDAIRFYTVKHFDKSVETDDFRRALEESSGVDLEDFFNEWVYKNES